MTIALEYLTRLYEQNVSPDCPVIAEDIVRNWRSMVDRHFSGHPMTEKEWAAYPEIPDASSPYHLYGTTLVAMLKTPSYLLILQQGDGCCLLLDNGGLYHLPLPDDPRCVGNKTSSLADMDAATGMRMRVLSDRSERLMACLLGSDGIHKSFADDEGLFDFCDWVILQSASGSRNDLSDTLSGEFERLSASGASDDMSLAGIVCDCLPDDLISTIKSRFNTHEAQRDLQNAKSKLVSMTRKHQKLEKLWQEDDPIGLAEYPRYHAEYLTLRQRVTLLERQLYGDREVCQPID